MCKRSGELIDHSYLHCLVALTLWHKMLRLVGIEWVATRNVVEMLTISYQGFGLRQVIMAHCQGLILSCASMIKWCE